MTNQMKKIIKQSMVLLQHAEDISRRADAILAHAEKAHAHLKELLECLKNQISDQDSNHNSGQNSGQISDQDRYQISEQGNYQSSDAQVLSTTEEKRSQPVLGTHSIYEMRNILKNELRELIRLYKSPDTLYSQEMKTTWLSVMLCRNHIILNDTYMIEKDLITVLLNVSGGFGWYYKRATGRKEGPSKRTVRQIAVICALHSFGLIDEMIDVVCDCAGIDESERKEVREAFNGHRKEIVCILWVLVYNENMDMMDGRLDEAIKTIECLFKLVSNGSRLRRRTK